MQEQLFEAVVQAFRASQEAFNRRDFETAFAGVSPDVEWHVNPSVPGSGVIRGRDALIAFYESMEDAGDWEVTLEHLEDLGNGRLLAHQRGRARGRTTGIEHERDFFQVYEIGAEGVERVREFETRDAALAH